MSQLFTLILAVCFFVAPAFGMTDSNVARRLAVLENQLKAERSLEGRIRLTEEFKDFLADYLEQYKVVETPAGKKEFAELNEFYTSVLLIRIDAKKKSVSCRERALQIRKEGLLPDEGNTISPSAQRSLKILNLICQ